MHPDGTGVKQVSKDPNCDFTSPSWAPEGKYIFVSKSPAVIGSNEIWMYHMDGGTGVQITKAKPAPNTKRDERPNATGVVASPDGKYLYYAAKLGSLKYNQQFPSWHIARRDRKTGDQPTYKPAAHRYAIIDVDENETPVGWHHDMKAAVQKALEWLPPELRGVDVAWRLTGSAGTKPGIRLRLAFMLDCSIDR